MSLTFPIAQFLSGGGGTGDVAADAIWDAAGDLVYATAANTAARLAIGTANQVLRVNAGATAPEWGTAAVAGGGTGVASLTAYAPIFGGTTSTGPLQSGTVGTAGQVLTSNGAAALPTFQAAGARVVENIATGSAYTLVTGDANKIKRCVDTSAQTINITTAFNGLAVELEWLAGAGTVTLDANAGVNLNGLGDGVNIVLSAAAGSVSIIPVPGVSNQWDVVGAIGDLLEADITDLHGTGLDVDATGFRGLPQNSQSAAYTCVAADAGKHLYHPSADTTARTWTIPANSSVAYEIGTTLTFVNDSSAGVITIAITTDTLVLAGAGTTGSRTLAANGIATAIKMTATRWQINGTGLT